MIYLHWRGRLCTPRRITTTPMRIALLALATFVVAAAPSAQSLADADSQAPAIEATVSVSAEAPAAVAAPASDLAVDLSDFASDAPAVLPPVDMDVQSPPGDEGHTMAYWGSVAATGAGLLFLSYLMFG